MKSSYNRVIFIFLHQKKMDWCYFKHLHDISDELFILSDWDWTFRVHVFQSVEGEHHEKAVELLKASFWWMGVQRFAIITMDLTMWDHMAWFHLFSSYDTLTFNGSFFIKHSFNESIEQKKGSHTNPSTGFQPKESDNI